MFTAPALTALVRCDDDVDSAAACDFTIAFAHEVYYYTIEEDKLVHIVC